MNRICIALTRLWWIKCSPTPDYVTGCITLFAPREPPPLGSPDRIRQMNWQKQKHGGATRFGARNSKRRIQPCTRCTLIWLFPPAAMQVDTGSEYQIIWTGIKTRNCLNYLFSRLAYSTFTEPNCYLSPGFYCVLKWH